MKDGDIGALAWARHALLLLLGASAVHAQPVVEKPKVEVGDAWHFKRTSSDGTSNAWARKVVEIVSADHVRVQTGENAVADFDGALNVMPEGNVARARVLVKYPLKIGDEWSFERRFADPGNEEIGKAKVVSYESISVPAGTFQCYRVEAESSQAARRAKTVRVWKRWYCPDVKWIAKEVLETTTSGTGGRLGGSTVETSELTSFTPGK